MNASSQEEKYMPAARKGRPAVEQNPDLEAVLFGVRLTTVEVADLLKIHRTTVYQMAKRAELPAFKVGHDWWFDRAQIEQWMRSRMRGPEG